MPESEQEELDYFNSKLDEDSKKIVDEFSAKSKGLEISELKKLKDEYLQKIENGG